ncbi:phage tail protein [Dyadobacter sp. CY107]|uniref:phage tail protein n=1 Tax=Dyadobacter fanqingshengii TaxID=2906443 RepID=UPI001F41F39C|nr:phage tail protein [Dyadobacter fanqingshengii]MCF2504881.1 phage tail protein [Dyadobacter fanqingshengii]
MYTPPVGFRFKAVFQGIDGVGDNDTLFQDVSGLTREIELEEVKDGANPMSAFKFPKKVKYTNLVLKRGMFVDSALVGFFDQAVNSYFNVLNLDSSTCDITISLLGETNEPLISWTVYNAFPVKWVISDFKASGNEIVVESLEFSYQRFKRN